MSRDIKMLANKYKIPIVCIASINRGYEARSDHRPRLADFRDSGNIEYDIDLGLLLYRPAMFPTSGMSNEEYVNNFDKCEVIIAKNRYGLTGDTLPFIFHARESKFAEE